MDGTRVGRNVRVLRQRRGWRQRELAARAGVSQATVSVIERGRIEGTTLRTVAAVLGALDASASVDVRWQGGTLDRLLDERHAALAGCVAELLGALGWERQPEVTYAHFGERGAIDILAWHARTRSLLVIETKTELSSVEETLRRHDQKVRLAAGIARERFGWQPATVSRLLVFPEQRTIRRRVERQASLLRTALPDRGLAVRAWPERPSGVLTGMWFLSSSSVARGSQGLAKRQRVRTRGPLPATTGAAR